MTDLAPYAVKETIGRQFEENPAHNRSPFQRDRDRMIHSSSFRRLDGKTQVFVYHEGKNYRTRLTHSLEVSQIARTMSRTLKLNEDLVEAIALAHDIGHPPFGHAGERGLRNAMANFGGFSHNSNSLKVTTKLETHYPRFIGLNLTFETLEGIAKHNGPLKGRLMKHSDELTDYIKAFDKKYNLRLKTQPSLEAQLAAISDDVAYCNHDLDDGYRAGLFTIEDLKSVPILDKIIRSLHARYENIDEHMIIYGIVRQLIRLMVDDIVTTATTNIEKSKVKTVDDVRNYGKLIITFSGDMQKEIKSLRKFLKANLYNHYQVVRADIKAQKMVEDIFKLLISDYRLLPTFWQSKIDNKKDINEIAITVGDYIASLTDKMAIEEHRKLFNPIVSL